MTVIGGVFKSGMAFPKNAEEAKSIINCGEDVILSKFLDLPTAYIAMVKEYENRGIANKTLLPAPTLEDLATVRFFSTESFTEIMERNKLKNRWFTLWSFDCYGIFNNIDILVDAFFSPSSNFLLTEVNSPDEAVNEIFVKYANVTFPLYAYCGGVPIPMLSNQFTFNVLVRAPYSQYIATNCVIPQKLNGLLPVKSSVNADTKIEIAGLVDQTKGGS